MWTTVSLGTHLAMAGMFIRNLKEWMHLPEKGCQMCLSVPEGQENGNPGCWKATRGGEWSSRRQLVCPGQILCCQIKWFVQMSCVRCLGRGHHRGRAEGRWGENSGDGAGMQEEEEKGRYCEDKSGGKQDKPASPQSIEAVLGQHPFYGFLSFCHRYYSFVFHDLIYIPDSSSSVCHVFSLVLHMYPIKNTRACEQTTRLKVKTPNEN